MILGPKTRFYHAFGEAHTTGIAYVSVSDSEAEDLANARLIAAAPDLLAALENLVSDWERVHGQIPADHEARAAIARATGNQ